MFAYELEGLKRLNIQPIKWGSSYRVKVRGRTGKMVYVSNVSRPINQRLVAKQYNVSIETLEKHLSPDYKADPKYRFYNGNHMESHLYEGVDSFDFYSKLENVLSTQTSAFKINIALGYELVSKTDPDDTRYFYPNLADTHVFNNPIAINSKANIQKKVISEIRSMELADKLNHPSSGYKLKVTTAFKIFIYHRDHALGDSEAVIPKIFRENKHVINFPKTNNKCGFHCIAWHTFQSPKRDPRRIQAQVKEAFKRYCSFKGVKYSLSLLRVFKPIDLLQLDEVEDCFQLGINVYKMDVVSGNATYQCPKGEMVFVSAETVKNHKKNQCELVNIESFPAEPTIYKPAQNTIRSLLTKYSFKDADQYIDHFIVYDFEAILKPTATQHGENTVFTNEHIPLSVSVADSLTEEVRCFVNDEPKMLLVDMFKYIGDVSVKVQQFNVNKYRSLLQKIINAHGLTGMEIPGVNLGKKYNMTDVINWIKEGKSGSFFDFHSSLGFGKQRSDYGKLKQQLDQGPVFGFNSGRYDINLIKKDLFAVIGTDNIKSGIKNPSYMCIATLNMRMLDISNYVPAGTSYDKYLTTYLGGCKCDDKIRCVGGLGKGLFPYEYITSFNVLNQTTLPPKSAFDSKLRGTSITDDNHERVKFVWTSIWICLLMACRYLVFRRRSCITCFNNLQYSDKKPASAFQFPTNRLGGYKSQDTKAKRQFGMTLLHLNTLLQNQKYLCGLCYCQLTADIVLADRINNKLGHIDGNILISCVKCNTARKDMSLGGFRYMKLLEFNSNRLVYSIDQEEKDIYAKMKANIAGGPSIIFNRYAKRNETTIRGGKVCKKIIGYDANALYLWAIGNEMPCGRSTTIDAYPGIVDDIIDDKILGFLEYPATPKRLLQ
ncbi:unnamed protein product [Phytophthora fragariaefolia]|uniref:Unnamed protein product n=1 Tax=Phytophthora fragariaefolia TaxID=1490495 RepID=A0A9W6XE85_9STRA|nr:unnamed protein product [Phytophthora fragariaefolia]